MAITSWTMTRISRQVAETDNALKQEDAILMLAEIKPANRRRIARALEGLNAGSANRKVTPAEKTALNPV